MNTGFRQKEMIPVPSREPFCGSITVLLVAGVMSIAFVLPGGGGRYTLIALSLFLVLSIFKRYLAAIQLSVIALLFFLPIKLGGIFRFWPFTILIPLIFYALIVSYVPQWRKSADWLKRGEMDFAVLKLVVAATILSAIGLIAWVVLLKPDIKQHLALIPELPFWIYPFAGIAFSVLNAALEEAVFRGIVMQALDSAVGIGFLSITVQAISFGAFHYLAGFPNGVSGFIMTLVYGIMLGLIRRVSKGLLAPFITHIAADITIFSILMFFLYH